MEILEGAYQERLKIYTIECKHICKKETAKYHNVLQGKFKVEFSHLSEQYNEMRDNLYDTEV